MAALFILAGGLFGFATALASLFLTEIGLFWALALWSAVGLGFTALGLVFALRSAAVAKPHRTQQSGLSGAGSARAPMA